MRWSRWQDWATVILGVALMATPLVTQTTNTAAICVAYGMGGLIALAGLAAAYTKTPSVFEWLVVLLGVVTIAMPFIFQYTNETFMAWAAWIVGAATIVSSGYEAVLAPKVAAPA
jgi:uncharacterized membrane protein HdeD (DUF308 family)